MTYIKDKPKKPTFSQSKLNGYQFPLVNKEIEVYFVDVTKGHENYIISKTITHVYYILEGKGSFDINGKKYYAKPGELIEVPPNVEYTYSGSMKLLLIMNPPWFEGNENVTKRNSQVN